MDDDCEQQVPSGALCLQQFISPAARRRSCSVYNSGLTPTRSGGRADMWTCFFGTRTSPQGGGGVWGRIWMRQQYISAANFLIVFHSNCGTILLSFWDMTTGRTADDGRRTDDSNDRIIWPLRRTSNKRWVDTV